MEILDKVKIEGEAAIWKLKDGNVLSKDEQKVVQIYNSLFSGKNPRSGKRVKNKS